MSVLPVCIYAVHACLHQQGTEEVLGPLELELWMVVRDHVGARDQAWTLWKNSCSFLLNHLSTHSQE